MGRPSQRVSEGGWFKQRIREITQRAKGVSLKTTIAELTAYMRGWRGYFELCETPRVLGQTLIGVGDWMASEDGEPRLPAAPDSN